MDVLYKNQGTNEPMRVYFDNAQGAEEVILKRGTALSFNFAWAGTLIDDTVVTAESMFPGRCQIVKLPENGDKTFAGVTTQDYKIPAGKGCWILIHCPGSVALIRTLVSSTAASTALSYSYDASAQGTFKAAGTNKGKGVAIAMQTLNPGGSEALLQVYLEEGATSSPVS